MVVTGHLAMAIQEDNSVASSLFCLFHQSGLVASHADQRLSSDIINDADDPKFPWRGAVVPNINTVNVFFRAASSFDDAAAFKRGVVRSRTASFKEAQSNYGNQSCGFHL